MSLSKEAIYVTVKIEKSSFQAKQEQSPFFQDAELLFQAIESGQVVGYITATTLTDIFYIARRHTRSVEQARQAVAETLTVMEICPVNRAVLESAFGFGLADFEDAVQIACAVA